MRWRPVLRFAAVATLWVVVVELGLAVASAVHLLGDFAHAGDADALGRFPLDYTLRLATSMDRCLGAQGGLRKGSVVRLETCGNGTASQEEQQFTLWEDGTIHARVGEELCMTMGSGDQVLLMACNASAAAQQKFERLPTGKFAVQAALDKCIQLLNGDVAAGDVGIADCADDLNEVFVFGGRHFLVPELEGAVARAHDLPLMQRSGDASRAALGVRPLCVFIGAGLLLAGTLLTVASYRAGHGCDLKLAHFASWLLVAVASCLLCHALLSTAPTLVQQAKLVESAQAALTLNEADHSLRMAKWAHHCLGVEGDVAPGASVKLQPCDSTTTEAQQFLVRSDGTIRARHDSFLCISEDGPSKTVVLARCSASQARWQNFSAEAISHAGQLRLNQASLCMTLMNNAKAGGLMGFSVCQTKDINQVFSYDGGNVGVNRLASQLQQSRRLLREAVRQLDQRNSRDFFKLLHFASLGGSPLGAFLMLLSLALLVGSC